MSDIDRLTVVVALGFVMLVARIPEQDVSHWGLPRLTLSLGLSALLLWGMSIMVFQALFASGW